MAKAYFAVKVTASKGFRAEDLEKALALMGCPDPEAGLRSMLSGGWAEVRDGKSGRPDGLSLAQLRGELAYGMRTGEGRRIDDPAFSGLDAKAMLRRIRNRSRRKGR
jgi:hypothetical protein